MAEDQRSAVVQGARQSACGGCSAKLGCGYGMRDTEASSKSFSLPFNAPIEGVAAGDSIRLELPASELPRLAFWAYTQPLLLAMVAVTLASWAAPAQTGLQVVALLLGLAFGARWAAARPIQQALTERLEISKCSHRK